MPAEGFNLSNLAANRRPQFAENFEDSEVEQSQLN